MPHPEGLVDVDASTWGVSAAGASSGASSSEFSALSSASGRFVLLSCPEGFLHRSSSGGFAVFPKAGHAGVLIDVHFAPSA